jgi:hypothetical protein
VQSEPGARLGAIHAKLAIIEREISVLLAHLDASDDEINAAIEASRKQHRELALAAVGAAFVRDQHSKRLQEIEAALRRMRR